MISIHQFTELFESLKTFELRKPRKQIYKEIRNRFEAEFRNQINESFPKKKRKTKMRKQTLELQELDVNIESMEMTRYILYLLTNFGYYEIYIHSIVKSRNQKESR